MSVPAAAGPLPNPLAGERGGRGSQSERPAVHLHGFGLGKFGVKSACHGDSKNLAALKGFFTTTEDAENLETLKGFVPRQVSRFAWLKNKKPVGTCPL